MKDRDIDLVYKQIQDSLRSYDQWKPQVIDCPKCKHKTMGIKTSVKEVYGTMCSTCGGLFDVGLVEKIVLKATKK